MAQDIRPPRVDLGEVRNARGDVIGTVTISKAWFFWLRDILKSQDDASIAAAFDAAYGVAASAQVEQKADEAVLIASLPVQPQDFTSQIDEARLLTMREPPQDWSREIEESRLQQAQLIADLGELRKEIEEAKLLAIKVLGTNAAGGADHGELTGLADNDHSQYLLVADIDDTPVNGEVAQPISSNWAFDHVAAADPHTVYRLESVDHTHQSTGAEAGQLDHGLALTGLTDDDHSAYLLASDATNRATFAANWTDLTDGGTTTLHTHTSGVASSITVANEATDTTCFLLFATAATGDLGPKSNANLTLNSSTGVVTFASTVLTTTDINAGTIDNTEIGATTAQNGTFINVTASGNITTTAGAIIPVSTIGIAGTATNDDPTAGYVGQYVSSAVASGSAVNAGTTDQWSEVTSISLTAGDWDVSIEFQATPNGGTVTYFQCGLGTVSGNNSTGVTQGDTGAEGLGPTATANVSASLPAMRVSLSGTTTYYLKFRMGYTVATPKAFGRISARRVR